MFSDIVLKSDPDGRLSEIRKGVGTYHRVNQVPEYADTQHTS